MTTFKMADLNQLRPMEIPEDERVKERFIQIYNLIHNSKEGALFYEKEKIYFLKAIRSSKDLQSCNPLSVYGTFIDLASMGLSLQGGTKSYIFILSYNANIGTRDKPDWEKRMYLEVSPYGELALRIHAGQIKYADNPVIVYEGDRFRPHINQNGIKIIDWEANIPRKSNRIVGSFIRIVRPNDTFDFYYMTEDDISRLKTYSSKKNKGEGNALYSSNEGQIDTGFLEAKTLKHAFRSFPKLNLGQFAVLQNIDRHPSVDYGLDKKIDQHIQPDPITETAEIIEEVKEETF